MSSEIQLLSESVVRKIAAGEVIERPASVVKELVENSIDAEARRVIVEIGAGGQQFISVADDGRGMTRRDAELSTERHATSKMHSAGDLFGIDTLGFRGEALASIAAVSRLIIETRHRDDEAGTRLVIEGGVRRELAPAARDPGTTVRARSLFFNTPARRKFLRHVDTEARYITQALSQLAAAHPEVAFQLKHQERQVLNLRPAERVDRTGELLGAPPDELLVSDWETSGLSVHVILCPPALCKRSRGKQFLIVRGRAIYSRALSSAVYAGYGGLLPHNTHPAYVLWLDVDPRQVDVNVHPTKREVRFADERGVGESVQHAVRQAMNMPEVPAFAAGPWPEKHARVEPVAGEALGAFHTSPGGESPAGDSQPGPQADQLKLSMLAPSTASATPLSEAGSAIAEEAMAHLRASRSMWQLHNKYLLAPIPDGLALIDQHVAHERIRYEEVIDCLKAEGGRHSSCCYP